MADNNQGFNVVDLEETFNRAADHLRSLVSGLDSGQLLGFYGLYKQAVMGPCNEPRPNWYQTQARHKWEAWNSLGDTSREVAMGSYIRAVQKLDPTWEENSHSASGTWVAVSKMPNTDVELRDVEKGLLDWVKDGNEEKVHEALTEDTKQISVRDEDGMLPVHWAADRGHVSIFRLLVDSGADINVRDNDGQTPLHYAASCSHIEVIKYLVSIGAAILPDNDGMTPPDIADPELAVMFTEDS
ncbi:acyl-CoA-binding domain-containing protein 6 [Orussus abietinus]|uniref:acyl-CoA-binding domain-containing protein 6 n=1 Tax=Orussus abietinus TaxID=222816 RepID=UPI000625FBB9|nr:acyl-CoA-binding domain-containing protein 6 [Orussus abietinus]